MEGYDGTYFIRLLRVVSCCSRGTHPIAGRAGQSECTWLDSNDNTRADDMLQLKILALEEAEFNRTIRQAQEHAVWIERHF